VQPMVESKIAYRVLTDITAKSTHSAVEALVSQDLASLAEIVTKSSVDGAVSTLYAALKVFKQARPYGGSRLRHDQACWAAEMFLNEWEGLVVVQFD
jgi:hypothetical protein